jgi:hypothetical protein
MQVFICRVNIDAHRVAGAPGQRCGSSSTEGALPVAILGHARPHALAVVGVGLAVAAADRPVEVRTESRHARAGTPDLGDEAFAGLFLAEQAGSE